MSKDTDTTGERSRQGRQALRIPIRIPEIFSSGYGLGEGTVVNISTPGCAIESEKALRVGDYIRPNVYLPDERLLRNVRAAVRWAQGRRFGVEFLRLSEKEQACLSRLVSDHTGDKSRF